jgi:hypothetical protein
LRAAGVEYPVNDDIPENDALWRLLGKSRPPSASPFFARNVLREIRQTRPTLALPLHALLRWLAPAAYTLLALGFLATLQQGSQTEPPASASLEPPAQFEALADLLDPLPPVEFTPAHLAGL